MANLVQKGFLKIEGPTIQGDATISPHSGEIAILDVSFGVSQAGKYEAKPKTILPNATDCSIRKYMGASSPELAQACARKTAIDKATITFPGRLTLTLSRCLVTNVHPSLNVEEDMPTEIITLSFRKMEWVYEQDDKKGTGDFDLDDYAKN